MDNFRKRNRDTSRRSIDSILNAPTRPYSTRQPQGRGLGSMDGLRPTTGRRLDDFKRPDGLHQTPSAGVRSSAPQPTMPPKHERAGQNASLLHMTLPSGGMLGEKPAKKTKTKTRRGRLGSIRKWGLRSAIALVALTLIVGGFLLFKGILKVNKVFKGGGSAAALEGEVKPEFLKGEGDGRVNILLLGKGGVGHAGADLTDTIIVASIDPISKTSTLVSIPRDLWVTPSGFGATKINAVYANAKNRALNTNPKDKNKAERTGVDATQKVISQILGIPIHYYGMIDFEGFKQAVDIVGGVDINVPKESAVQEHLWDSTRGRPYYLNVQPGMQHFDSTKALYFARSRHTSLRGDFSRSERQRLLIQALSQKVLSAGTYTNPVKINSLMDAFGDHLSTDFSVNNALRLADLGKTMDMSKLKSIGLADPPNNFVRTDNINGLSVVRPTAGLGDYSQIQNYIRNTLRDPYLAKEGARIAVLNGTPTAGLATKKADELKSYGYNVTVIDNAPTLDYANAIFVDLTGGKKPFTRSYLEKRLGTKAVSSLPDANISTANVDFVVILGQN
jgi:polyisoprenyl-teichoic acid--peptidoglycan teichoic acid transferase